MNPSAARVERCEVCRATLPDRAERPDPRRRRCADHLGQAVLFPLTALPGRKGARR
jgi:hypothetical protein